MTERGRLCFFLDRRLLVRINSHTFDFFCVTHDWDAEMKAFLYGKGIGFPSIAVAIHSEYLWFVLSRVPAPLLGGMNSHRVWQKLQTGC